LLSVATTHRGVIVHVFILIRLKTDNRFRVHLPSGYSVQFYLCALVTAASPSDEDGLGDLTALAWVSAYLGRVKCATLPWNVLRSALEGS
jgi:hypothetical protein